jgi:hypothetical protein
MNEMATLPDEAFCSALVSSHLSTIFLSAQNTILTIFSGFLVWLIAVFFPNHGQSTFSLRFRWQETPHSPTPDTTLLDPKHHTLRGQSPNCFDPNTELFQPGYHSDFPEAVQCFLHVSIYNYLAWYV